MTQREQRRGSCHTEEEQFLPERSWSFSPCLTWVLLFMSLPVAQTLSPHSEDGNIFSEVQPLGCFLNDAAQVGAWLPSWFWVLLTLAIHARRIPKNELLNWCWGWESSGRYFLNWTSHHFPPILLGRFMLSLFLIHFDLYCLTSNLHLSPVPLQSPPS